MGKCQVAVSSVSSLSDGGSVAFAKSIVEGFTGRTFLAGNAGPGPDLRSNDSPFRSIQVKQITNENYWRALDWQTDQEMLIKSDKLRWFWTLALDTGETAPNFRAIRAGIEPILLDMEERGIRDCRRFWSGDWIGSSSEFQERRQLQARLHGLIGGRSMAMASDPFEPDGSPRFWMALSSSWASVVLHNSYAVQLSTWVASEEPVAVKLRKQLEKDNDPETEGFLVLDNTTGMGWSLDHLKGGLPTVALLLPSVATGLWVAQKDVLAWYFSPSIGWVDVSGHMP